MEYVWVQHADSIARISLTNGENSDASPALFKASCASLFQIDASTVVGFRHGSVIYPPSFVTAAGSKHFLSDTPLELVLDTRGSVQLAGPLRADAAPDAASGRSILAQYADDDPVLEFGLVGQIETVAITMGDLKSLAYMRSRTGLNRVGLAKLHTTFRTAADGQGPGNGALSKEAFDTCVRLLVPGGSLGAEDKRYLSLSLSKLFYAFDRDGTNTVDFTEFLTGFSVLASGDARSKLRMGFLLFDADNDGLVSALELKGYMRSFLTVVLALNSRMSELPSDYVQRLIDDTSETVVRRVFFETDAEDHAGYISFQELEAWYNAGGDELMPWVELLGVSQRQISNSGGGGDDDDGYGGDGDEEDDESMPVFEFYMARGCGTLAFYVSDIESLELIVATTRLDEVDPEILHEIFASASMDGALSKAAFDRCIRDLVPGESLSKDEKTFLSYTLSNIFYAFDREGENEVRLKEFASGFSLLSQGSKSDKLALAFALCDGDDDGLVTGQELARFLRAFLTVLCALNEDAASLAAEDVYRIIDQTALTAANEVLTFADSDLVDFEAFGTWYNHAGHELVPWLELLDIKKWPIELEEDALDDDDDDDVSALPLSAVAPAPAAAVPADPRQGAAVVFQFDLADGKRLQVKAHDVTHLELVVGATGLDDLDPEQLQDAFIAASDGGALSKAAFDRCIRTLVPGTSLSREEQTFLSFALSNIFYAYDREGRSEVRVKEFVSGFSLLSAGSKSDKLALAFNLFDADGDGRLTGQELARFLRSFLTVLFALNEDAAKEPAEDVWTLIDESALDFADRILESCAASTGGLCSFQEFADWYTTGGCEHVPWLELLDLRKWPMELDEAAGAVAGAANAPMPMTRAGAARTASSAANNNEGVRRVALGQRGGTVFEFQLSDGGDALVVRTKDVTHLQLVLATTRLDEVDPEVLHDLFAEAAEAGVLTKAAFDSCIRDLVPGEALSKDEKTFLSYALSNVFFAFDRDGQSEVHVKEFASGFSLLSQGSKSDKLALAFSLFDADGDGRLNRQELWRFLRSFLTVLFALNEESSKEPAEDVWLRVDEAAVELTAKLFVQSVKANKDRISFEEFADWYSGGGYRLLPWIELLDLKKWPIELPEDIDDGEYDTADDLEGEDLEGEEEAPVFQFRLTEEGDVLELRGNDIANLEAILSTTTLDEFPPEEMQEIFIGASSDGALTKAAFDRCVRDMVPGEGLSKEAKTFLSYTLSNIFFAYDREGRSEVRVKEFVSGFSLLSAGSKSDKLALAFSLFDADGDGRLTGQELARFLRSFLTVLFALNEDAAKEPAEDVWTLIDESALEFADKVLQQGFSSKSYEHADKVGFEEFADWYTAGGYELVPWLELLNLAKWPLQL